MGKIFLTVLIAYILHCTFYTPSPEFCLFLTGERNSSSGSSNKYFSTLYGVLFLLGLPCWRRTEIINYEGRTELSRMITQNKCLIV